MPYSFFDKCHNDLLSAQSHRHSWTYQGRITHSWTTGGGESKWPGFRCEVDSIPRPVSPQLTTLTTRPPGLPQPKWKGWLDVGKGFKLLLSYFTLLCLTISAGNIPGMYLHSLLLTIKLMPGGAPQVPADPSSHLVPIIKAPLISWSLIAVGSNLPVPFPLQSSKIGSDVGFCRYTVPLREEATEVPRKAR